MSSQITFRKFGIQVYINEDNEVIVNTKGFHLSILPFFFKNRLNLQQLSSPKIVAAASSTGTSTPYVLVEDAGIPKQLNETIFDILSRAQYLSSLQHENLSQFITAQPSQKHHDQILVISEDYNNSLKSLIKDYSSTNKYIESSKLGLYCFQILKALCYLHQHRITHRNLSIENIKIDQDDNIKLTNYGLYHLSNEGENVSFPIGNLVNLSAESIMMDVKGSSNPKCDVWALGCVMIQTATNNHSLWSDDRDPKTILNRILYLSNMKSTQFYNLSTLKFEQRNNNNNQGDLDNNNNDSNMKIYLNSLKEFNLLEKGLKEIIGSCLIGRVEQRPSAQDLLDHPYFNGYKEKDLYADVWVEKPCTKSSNLPDDLEEQLTMSTTRVRKHFDVYSPLELFYLWKLAGGELEKELVKQGLATPSPSVHKLPLFVPLVQNNGGSNTLDSSERIVHSRVNSVLYNTDTCMISIAELLVPKFKTAYLSRDKLLAQELAGRGDGYLLSGSNKKKKKRDSHVEYQIARLREFHKALYRYQYGDATQAQPLVIRLAKFGIPSILRGDIWAAILGVNDAEMSTLFKSINLDQKGPNDKQFELDIPRCHQYHPLMSSKRGHLQLYRVLKAWSLLNIDKGCYWQGLDNVATPFVVHNFQNDARAFGSLKAFVDKYLKILYVPNNYAALNEMMLVYQQLLSYHDPELSVHLMTVQLEPNLYAIPWFITVFAHLLPIDKIDILWDTILLGPSSLPYFFAVSIMTQFRSLLIGANLEVCIKTLSRIPACDIGRCVDDALDRFNVTPLSTTITKYVVGADDDLWWMQQVELEHRKLELFPRINIHDLINLQGTKAHVLDIRPLQQFNSCHYPQSININISSTTNQQQSTNQLNQSGQQGQQSNNNNQSNQSNTTTPPILFKFNNKITQQLEQCRGSPIVVISSRQQLDEQVEFCNQLVRMKFPFVSLLNGGIDALEHGASTILIHSKSNNNDRDRDQSRD